jgi:hypothetical protein
LAELILQGVLLVVGTAFIILIIVAFVVGDQSFQGCAISKPTDSIKLAIEQYSGTVQQLLTLSTTLIAVEAAVLLGFQKGLRLTQTRRILIFFSTIAFAFAAYFALFGRADLAISSIKGVLTYSRVTQ